MTRGSADHGTVAATAPPVSAMAGQRAMQHCRVEPGVDAAQEKPMSAMQMQTTMHTSMTTVTDALTRAKKPILFVTCPRGLFDEAPGLYAPEHRAQLLVQYPHVTHRELTEFNHYTVVMAQEGATRLAGLIDEVARENDRLVKRNGRWKFYRLHVNAWTQADQIPWKGERTLPMRPRHTPPPADTRPFDVQTRDPW